LESYNLINWFSNATPNTKQIRSCLTSKQIAEFLKNTYGFIPACHESCADVLRMIHDTP